VTTANEVRGWLDSYLRAWASNEPDDIRALFTEDAVYNGRPHDPEAWRGREAIVAGWLEHRDEPGNWSFEAEVLAVDGDRAFVQAVTLYTDGPDYDNLWILSFTDGRVSEFTEWFMSRDD